MSTEIALTTEELLPTKYGTPEQAALVTKFARALTTEGDLLEVPTLEERKALKHRNYQVQAMCRPITYSSAHMDRATHAVSRMLQGFRNLKFENAAHAAKMTASYFDVLKDLQVFAIEEACAAFGAGQITRYYLGNNQWGTHDPAFCPSELVLCHVVREKAQPVLDEQARLAKILNAKKSRPLMLEHNRSPEQQAEVNEHIASAKSEMAKRAAELEIVDKEKELANAEAAKKFTEKTILDQYKTMGVKPLRARSGLLISPSLAKTLGLSMKQSDDEFHAEHEEPRMP